MKIPNEYSCIFLLYFFMASETISSFSIMENYLIHPRYSCTCVKHMLHVNVRAEDGLGWVRFRLGQHHGINIIGLAWLGFLSGFCWSVALVVEVCVNSRDPWLRFKFPQFSFHWFFSCIYTHHH